jgi:hypothetical protein
MCAPRHALNSSDADLHHCAEERIIRPIDELRSRDPGTLLPEVTPEAVEAMTFSECLPPALAAHSLATRRRDQAGLTQLLEMTIRFVSVQWANPN